MPQACCKSSSVPRKVPRSPEEIAAFWTEARYRWTARARGAQLPPEDDAWSTWLFLAGRGTGKTRAGAETIRMWVESGRYKRIHLIAPTAFDARTTMVEGPAGILSVCPPWSRPHYSPSTCSLTWPNGAKAFIFSGDEPNRLRGPQCEALWADEVCAWRYPETWDMAMFGLRLGPHPRAIVTTTPKPTKLIKDLIQDPNTAVTRGSTYDNRANLAPSFFQKIIKKYENTRLGKQELEGQLLDDNPNALWKRKWIDDNRVSHAPNDLVRIVVGVDPATTDNEDSCATGIVVEGTDGGRDPHLYTLEDASVEQASPHTWATAAVAAYHRWKADVIVAESNNGGDMVASTIANEDKSVPVVLIHASRGKRTRAEPISLLCEKGKEHHVGVFPDLENELCEWEPGMPSPDRLDAKVWACLELCNEVAEFGISRVK